QSDSHDGAILAGEFRDVGDCSDRDNLHERGHLRLTTILAKQCVHELESYSDAREILVGVFTSKLVRIQHCESRRSAFLLIGQMMIGDDYVEAFITRPVEWFVCANAAVDTDDESVTIGECFLERWLLDAIAFREAMWNVKAGICAEEF